MTQEAPHIAPTCLLYETGITLAAAFAQRELSPYRRKSDNAVALLAHGLVFSWVFVMQLRLAGLFQRESSAVGIGVALCGATLAVFVVAVVLANGDRRSEARAKRTDDASEQQAEVVVERLPDGTTTQAQGAEVKEGQDEENRAAEAGVVAGVAAPSVLWNAGRMLCGELPAEDSGRMGGGRNDDTATLARRNQELATALAQLAQKDEELRVTRALLAAGGSGGEEPARLTEPGGCEGGAERHAHRPWW